MKLIQTNGSDRRQGKTVRRLCKRVYGAVSGFTGCFMSVEHRNTHDLTILLGSYTLDQQKYSGKHLNCMIKMLNAKLNK